MVLFLNVYITKNGISKLERGNLPQYDRLDIFKYCLSSMSTIKWKHVVIYYELDDEYSGEYNSVDEYLYSLFDNPIIYHFRNDIQSKWQIAMNKLFEIVSDEDIIWYSGNDDHIFIDYEIELIYEMERKLIELSKEHKYVAGSISHWTEWLTASKLNYLNLSKQINMGILGFYNINNSYMKLHGREDLIKGYGSVASEFNIIEKNNKYFVVKMPLNMSTMMLNKSALEYYWFYNDYGDTELRRSDTLISPEFTVLIPYRELVRHFDGYSHVYIDINKCPPLFIPEGFFENNIKILYCADKRKEGYVNINPLKKNYYSVDKNGADMKCVLEDIPLFWRNKISETIISKKVDERKLLRKRNISVIKNGMQLILIPLKDFKLSLRFSNDKISMFDWVELNFVRWLCLINMIIRYKIKAKCDIFYFTKFVFLINKLNKLICSCKQFIKVGVNSNLIKRDTKVGKGDTSTFGIECPWCKKQVIKRIIFNDISYYFRCSNCKNYFIFNKFSVNSNELSFLRSKISKILSKVEIEKTLIWGATNLTEDIFITFELNKFQFGGIVDKDIKKEGKRFLKYRIKNPANINIKQECKHIIIISKNNWRKIYNDIKYLEQEGIEIFTLYE